MKNTKLARSQRAAKRRMARFRVRGKVARGTQMVTRKGGQALIHKVPTEMPYVKGTLIGVGLGAEMLDALADIPWYGQLILGPLIGLGDGAFVQKTGEVMP